jgi:predicted nucleotidyltransferase
MGKQSNDKLRKAIAVDAAKLMYEGAEKEYFSAKRKAARRYGVKFKYQPQDLPSNREIKDQVQLLAEMFEGENRYLRLTAMRYQALEIMKILKSFHPKLIGSVLKGSIRKGSDIDIHVFSDSLYGITMLLEDEGYPCEVERKKVIKHNQEREFVHVHLDIDGQDIEITVYSADKKNFRFISSVTKDIMETANITELERLLEEA